MCSAERGGCPSTGRLRSKARHPAPPCKAAPNLYGLDTATWLNTGHLTQPTRRMEWCNQGLTDAKTLIPEDGDAGGTRQLILSW